ncbi:MAG: hypothetical protein ACREQP_11525, partial [Candidatus Binatia bacterium]
VLTLYITPVVYLYFESAAEKARGWRRSRREVLPGKPVPAGTGTSWAPEVPDNPAAGASFWSSFRKLGARRK